jgi:hypothetical protein
MSLEFAVDYPCSLRARYDEKHLRDWGRLGKLHSIVTTGDQHAPGPDKLQWIEQAAAEIDRLQTETSICSECPACLPLDVAGEGEAVGCLGRVNYPVDAHFEKFIADRVQLFLDTTEPEDRPRLFHILIDPESPFDGEATKELRRVTTADGLRFFELRLPIRLSRAGGHLTTDNVFDLLAGFRSEDSERTPQLHPVYETACRPGVRGSVRDPRAGGLVNRHQAFCSSTCLRLSKIRFVLLAASIVTGKVSADF